MHRDLTLGMMVLALVGAVASQSQAKDLPPNIVFIIADDLGYGDLGCYGQKKIRTPHLDRLASEGMRFTAHYSGSNVCAPSRCVLMTGKHPGHGYIRENRQAKGFTEGQEPVLADTLQLPLLLKKQGYVLGGFGKWGLGPVDSTGDPLKQGFDRWYGYNCQAVAHNYYPTHLWDNDKQIKLDNPKFAAHQKLPADADLKDPKTYSGFMGKEYAPDLIGEQARAFVRANKDRPFFLYYPTTVPHLALQVPENSLKEYAGTFPETPYAGDRGYLPHRQPRAAYAAMITRMDSDVGKLLALIKDLNLDERTLIVFTSDNGPLYDQLGGTDTIFFNSASGLRGRKGSFDEGGFREPCLVRWKGRIAAGGTSDRVTGFEDWLPSLLELSGARDKTPADLDGISFAPTLLGKKQTPRPFLYRESPGYGGQQCVRVGDWKAIRRNLNPGPKAADQKPGAIELYDLATDPGEKNDVAGKNPEVVARLRAIMEKQHVKSDLFPMRALDGGKSALAPPGQSRAAGDNASKQTGEHSRAGEYAEIRVIDAETGCGVPLVELVTVNHLRFVTDNAGRVAFNEPGLMDREVFFTVRSHGYEMKKDGFGFPGVKITPKAGQVAEVKIMRRNVAERLCRLTGEGRYRDTLLLGLKPPLADNQNPGRVAGQDSVQAVRYKGKVYWFWGDTSRMSYPLGLFRTSGAKAVIPARSDLTYGIAFDYFVDKTGFARAMMPLPERPEGVVWIDGVCTVPDEKGVEKLVAHYSRRKGLAEELEHGIATFDDERSVFVPAKKLPLREKWRFPHGHPEVVEDGGKKWLLCGRPALNVRVSATLKDVLDPKRYEAFTCATAMEKDRPTAVKTGSDEKPVWQWQSDLPPLGSEAEAELVKAGKLKPEQARFYPANAAEPEERVHLHSGTVRWNEHRKHWVMVAGQIGGKSSLLGEVWYAEAEQPTGPFRTAVKVVTHEKQSYYNVCHHSFLDRDGGRVIHFEGTYTSDFSGNPDKTPRYEYNQILYRLDLKSAILQPARLK